MMDYDDLIHEIINAAQEVTNCHEWGSGTKHAQSELDKAVNALKQALSQWVSVKDDLPKDEGEYLVYVKWLNPLGEWVLEQMLWDFENGKWGEDEDVIITHWMPLPAPPESEE
jgi:hypothetical protein